MNIFKYFRKHKEADQTEDGLKIYLDFEFKTFKFLSVDTYITAEQITLMIIEDILKSGISVSIEDQEFWKIEQFPFKKYSSIYLMIKMFQSNIIISKES